MAIQLINLGTPNGRDGDNVRIAFGKINGNFTELNQQADLENVKVSVRPETSDTHELGGIDRTWYTVWVGTEGIHIGEKTLTITSQGAIAVDGVVIATPGGSAANADWTATSGPSQILNKPVFSAVTISNDYRDLDHKPIIPTRTGQLVNDSGFTRFSGSYSDLTNKPTLFNGSYLSLTNLPRLFTGSYADLTNKPTLFTGSYIDLTNKPSIPTDINQLTDVDSLLGAGGPGGATDRLVNGGNTVSLGSDGKLTLPNDVKITPIPFNGIHLEIGTKIWNFDATGKLYLPVGGDIVDSTGTTVLGGTGGLSLTVDGLLEFPSGYSIGGSDTGLGLRMTTDRGTILFGNHPETPTSPHHFHIMKQEPANVDLFFGDDSNYVKLPRDPDYGVEIGTNYNTWRFGTDGTTLFPNDTIASPNTIKIKSGETQTSITNVYYGDEPTGYLAGNYTNQPTTSTNGTGLTVDYTCAVTNGPLTNIAIRNYGSGYNNGDTIIVDGGNGPDLSAQFDLSIIEPAEYQFTPMGALNVSLGVGIGQEQSFLAWAGPAFVSQLPPELSNWADKTILTSATDLLITTNMQSLNGPDPTFETLRGWQFGADGMLTLPAGASIGNGANSLSIQPASTSEEGAVFQISAGMSTGNIGGDLRLWAGMGADPGMFGSVDILGNVTVIRNELGQWEFGTDGSLTLPNGTVIGNPEGAGTSGMTAPIDTVFLLETSESPVTTVTSILNPGSGAIPSNSTGTAGVRYLLSGPGGAGVGMQVRFTSGGYAGGQILNTTDIEIINPGTGYQTGDQLTILNGNNDCTFVINVTSFNNTWTFGTDGSLTLPGRVQGGPGGCNSIDLSWDLTIGGGKLIRINPGSGGVASDKFWNFGPDGSILFPDLTVQTTAYEKVAVPITSKGTSGDHAGQVAFDSDYIYYCTASYDGDNNIWKRVALDATSWDNTPPPVTYTLTVNVSGSGNGIVTSSPAGIDAPSGSTSHVYTSGTVVTLTASAAGGSTFAGWAGPATGLAPATITVTSDVTVTATFDINSPPPPPPPPPTQYTLSVHVEGNGTVTSSPGNISAMNGLDSSDVFDESSYVNLTASPDSGYDFVGWSGDFSSGSANTGVLMDNNYSATATFETTPPPPPPTLVSIAITPANSFKFTGNDTTVQFTATGTYSDASTADITSTVTWDITPGFTNYGISALGAVVLLEGQQGTGIVIYASLNGISATTLLDFG